jgi:hypothetical protein
MVLAAGTPFLFPSQFEKSPETKLVDLVNLEEHDLLDLWASNYLPNKAYGRVVGYIGCGTPLLMRTVEYTETHGRLISEQTLIKRAKMLLADHARGEQLALLPCRTKGCAGTVPVGMTIRELVSSN